MNTHSCTKVAFKLFILPFVCCALGVGSVYAQGRFEIKPYVETGWQRDDNFHKSETNTRTVDTYYAKPGVQVGYTTEKSNLSLEYWLNYQDYEDQDDVTADPVKADDFDYTEHFFNFQGDTSPTDRITLGLNDLFRKTRDPAGADATSNATDRYKYIVNDFNPWLNYSFGEKFEIGLQYNNLLTDYSDDGVGQGEDSDENRGTFTLFYHFSPKTSVDINYQYWTRDYDKTTSDYDSNQVKLEVSHQINRITLKAGAGYHNRDFDDTSIASIDSPIWDVSMLGEFPKTNIKLSVEQNFNDSGTGNAYYVSTRFQATLTHIFFEKLETTLDGWYQNSDYEYTTREDDRWFASLAVDYLIHEYFSVGVEGGMEDRDSNQAGLDFDNKFIMANVKLNYNFGSK